MAAQLAATGTAPRGTNLQPELTSTAAALAIARTPIAVYVLVPGQEEGVDPDPSHLMDQSPHDLDLHSRIKSVRGETWA